MKKTIAIVGSLDTKGQEFAFLKAEIEKRGCATLVVDTAFWGKRHLIQMSPGSGSRRPEDPISVSSSNRKIAARQWQR